MMSPEASSLLLMLKNTQPHRELYRERNGRRFWLTYGGGPFSDRTVMELVDAGEIVPVYSTCPTEAFHVGLTIDINATIEARKKFGQNAPLIYLAALSGKEE